MDNVIELNGVCFAYNDLNVLNEVSLAVPYNEFLGVVGPNAGGKSTLLKILLGLLEPDKGTVSILGVSPKKARRRVGYVPQYPTFPRDFPINVEQTVLMGRLGVTKPFAGYSRSDREAARQAMVETEVDHLAGRRLNTLSGGQLQRVLVARALVGQPDLLLLDEPTSNIDTRVESEIFDLLKRLNERMTIIVVSHDIGFVSGYVQRVACLNQTLVCHDTASLDGKTVQELYGSDVHMVAHHHG